MNTIKRSEFTRLVEQGAKKNQLAEHFGIPKSQVTSILKGWGLRIKATRTPGYILEDDITLLEDPQIEQDLCPEESLEAIDALNLTPSAEIL